MSSEPAEQNVEAVCVLFHNAYEAAAVGAGWETQERSRKPWADVPEANKATMRATIRAVLDSDWYAERVAQAGADALAQAADAWLHGAWGDTPRHKDQVADRIGAAQYAGDWLRARAAALRGNA